MHRKSPEEEGLLSSLIALFCVYEMPLSGYGVRAKLKDWNISEYLSVSPATIYRSLSRLEDMGQLTSKVEKNGRYPVSRIYRITPAGKKRYRELLKVVGSFRRASHPMMPLIGLGSFLSSGQRVRMLQQWIRDAEQEYQALLLRLRDHSEGGTYGKPFGEWLLLDHEAARLKADISWLRKYQKLLESGKA